MKFAAATVNISSKVPTPPGKATKTSRFAHHRAFAVVEILAVKHHVGVVGKVFLHDRDTRYYSDGLPAGTARTASAVTSSGRMPSLRKPCMPRASPISTAQSLRRSDIFGIDVGVRGTDKSRNPLHVTHLLLLLRFSMRAPFGNSATATAERAGATSSK